ncbi:MAG TPA: MarR family transcriptional regulator [Methanocella sp.]|nr:MarR family transcriptional regulator [Methanocella sp.]
MAAEKERMRKAMGLIHGAISETLGVQKGRKSELSPVALSILYRASVKAVRMNDVASACDIRKSTASRHVDNLEKRGLVRRERDEADRRIVHVVATAKGKSLFADNEKQLAKYVEKGMDRLTPAEQEAFVGLLVKFTGADGD